ncbi:ATP-grasp domain-containing protein [uncultured Methanobacterium sp.]|uniref:carboxylate--amine ligase n=1 Tax=uncultured Methanobacterium sp. TaxID=176306 RepID=UPI002AA60F26|nr:ATP-grasp domain-containing protein [uncultured Methanobacterium sp.]
MYETAQKNGIPCAKTYIIDSAHDIGEIDEHLTFPCIIKPATNIGFQKKLGSRGGTIPILDLNELIYWKKKIIEKGLGKEPLTIQEIIVGPTTNLYTITSYSDRSADIMAYSIGHKIRQFPPDAGTIISGRVKNNPEIYELGKKTIKIMGYYGIANVEFKKDERDQKFKLVEINPRPGVWNYSVLMSGLNLPYIAYLDLLGESYELPANKEEGKVWLILIQDFFYSIFLFRFIGYPEYSISIGEWFRSTKGKKVYAAESWKDPLPGIIHFFRFFSQPIERLKKIKVVK